MDTKFVDAPDSPISSQMCQLTEGDIAQLAHEEWIQQGCPDGRALEHWLSAERRLREAIFLRGKSSEGFQAADPAMGIACEPVKPRHARSYRRRERGQLSRTSSQKVAVERA